MNHGKKFLNLSQAPFSGIVNCVQMVAIGFSCGCERKITVDFNGSDNNVEDIH